LYYENMVGNEIAGCDYPSKCNGLTDLLTETWTKLKSAGK